MYPKSKDITSGLLFFMFAALILSCSYSAPQESSENGLVFDGEIALSDSQILEFVWIEELGIWFGKYEVTLGQLAYMSKHARREPARYSPRYVEGDHDLKEFPAVMVGWNDAKDACSLLNLQYGDRFPRGFIARLPTESEWETVARYNDNKVFPWGNEWPPSVMENGRLPNLQGEEVIKIEGSTPRAIQVIEGYRDGWPSMAPVRATGANEWGVFGLGGNVSEWCEGWYDRDRNLRLLKGPSAFSNQPSQCKISWRGSVEGQSPARRLFFWGTTRNQGTIATGFRIVIGPE